MTPELARRVVSGLKQAGVEFISFLPDSRLVDMLPLLEQDEFFTTVCAQHEGTAVSMACGAALVGKKAAAYMEASGMYAALYNVQSLAIRCGLPLLLLVSHTGSAGDHGNSITYTGYGARTEPLLKAMGLPYRVLEDDHRVEERIGEMVRLADSSKAPVCLLFTGDFMAAPSGWT